jgi:acyl-homoserine lactone acylase PvdQ
MRIFIIFILNRIRTFISKILKNILPIKDLSRPLSSFENYRHDSLESSYNNFKKHFPEAVFVSNHRLLIDYSIKKAIKLNDNYNNEMCLEFGVYKGNTINYLSKFVKKIYGFDSFYGLSEDWVGGTVNHFEKTYSTMGELPKVNSNVQLIKGDIKETLETFINKNNSKIFFVNFDLDTYESTKFALSKIKKNFTSNTILYFDEFYDFAGWETGEYKAFKEEIEEDRNFSFKYLAFAKNLTAVTICVSKLV